VVGPAGDSGRCADAPLFSLGPVSSYCVTRATPDVGGDGAGRSADRSAGPMHGRGIPVPRQGAVRALAGGRAARPAPEPARAGQALGRRPLHDRAPPARPARPSLATATRIAEALGAPGGRVTLADRASTSAVERVKAALRADPALGEMEMAAVMRAVPRPAHPTPRSEPAGPVADAVNASWRLDEWLRSRRCSASRRRLVQRRSSGGSSCSVRASMCPP
jgi:hypothetical protein